jgi:hypothetical protein
MLHAKEVQELKKDASTSVLNVKELSENVFEL